MHLPPEANVTGSCYLQIEAIAKARDWTAGMAAYDMVLAKMKSVGTASLPTQGSAKKKRKQPESDSPAAAAQPPATDSIQRTFSKLDKKKKKAKAAAATNASPNTELQSQPAAQKTVLPSPVIQVTTVQQPAPAQRSRGRHVGRYHKTTAAKKAGSYSKSDLAAILGVDSFPTAAPVSLATAPQTSPEDQVGAIQIQTTMPWSAMQHTETGVPDAGKSCTY